MLIVIIQLMVSVWLHFVIIVHCIIIKLYKNSYSVFMINLVLKATLFNVIYLHEMK